MTNRFRGGNWSKCSGTSISYTYLSTRPRMPAKHACEGSVQRRTNSRIRRVFARYGTLCGSSHPVDLHRIRGVFDEMRCAISNHDGARSLGLTL